MPEIETVTFKLPDGQDMTVPLAQVTTDMQVQIRVVIDGKIVGPAVALAILQAERNWWQEKAQSEHRRVEDLDSKLGDARSELQQLRGKQ